MTRSGGRTMRFCRRVRWAQVGGPLLVITLLSGPAIAIEKPSPELKWEEVGLVAIGCRPKGSVGTTESRSTVSPPERLCWALLWDQRGHVLGSSQLLGSPQEYEYEAWWFRDDGQWIHSKNVSWAGHDPWTDLVVLKLPANNTRESQGRVAVFADPLKLDPGTSVWSPGGVSSWLSSSSRPNVTFETRPGPRGLASVGDKVDRPRWIYEYGGLLRLESPQPDPNRQPGPVFGAQGECLGWVLPWRWQSQNSKTELMVFWSLHLKRVVSELVLGNTPEFGFLGVRPRELSETVRKQVKAGVSVYEVGRRTPAENSGLQFGDVITRVNQVPVSSSQELLWRLGMLAPSNRVEIEFVRGARRDSPMVGTIGVTLAKRYVPPSEIDSHVGVNCGGIEVDWATAAPRFEKDWQKVDLRGAVVVLSVATNSPAWDAGLREGDFISEVGGESVRFPDEFAATWEKAADSIELKVNSGPNQSSRILRFPKIVASEK